MELVAAIDEVDHVTDGIGRLLRIALCQKIRTFMLVAKVACRRSVALREYQVPDNTETCRLPRRHEAVYVRPTVEADTEAVAGQDTVHLCECWFQPGIVIIVLDGTASTVFVAYQVGWISQDEINAFGLKLRHNVHTIAVDDGIRDDGGLRDGIHGVSPFRLFVLAEKAKQSCTCNPASRGPRLHKRSAEDGAEDVCREGRGISPGMHRNNERKTALPSAVTPMLMTPGKETIRSGFSSRRELCSSIHLDGGGNRTHAAPVPANGGNTGGKGVRAASAGSRSPAVAVVPVAAA